MTLPWLGGFWVLARKELKQALRTEGLLRELLLGQLLQIALFGWLDTTIRNVPTVIVDQDRTVESRSLVERIGATDAFSIKYTTSSVEQARGHIRAGRAKLAVVIPPDYGTHRGAHRTAPVLTLVDGSDSTASTQAIAAVEGVAGRINVESRQDEAASRRLSARAFLLFNPKASATSFMLPGLLAMLLAEMFMNRPMNALTSEREDGNLERLLLSPLSYPALIMGKLAPWFGMAVVSGLSYLLLMRFGLGVPIRGSVVLLVAGLVVYVLATLSIAMFIGASSGDSGTAGERLNYFKFPAFFASGFIFPIASLPKAMLPLAYALPQTHFIEIMRGVCLRGASAAELAPHLLFLAVIPFVLLPAASSQMSKSVLQ